MHVMIHCYISKTNKKIMRNDNWEYFTAQMNRKLSNPETQRTYKQRKVDVEPIWGIYEDYFRIQSHVGV